MARYNCALLLTIVAAVMAHDLVVLKQGPLKGHRLTTRKGRKIFAFQGIPYAKPPVGKLRFQPPQPAEPWSGVLDATKEAPICVQRGLFPSDPEIRGQEDCLYLNVYTPRLPAGFADVAPLDVMVWIHGGAWFSGSGGTDMYGPQYLLDKDIILVTINYRLGTLGFLSTEDAVCPGNNGLKDQVAALRWVRDNIALFGGNPHRVTILGQSAGGASTHLHMLSPLSKGLFHRFISQSGAATCPWAVRQKGIPKVLAEEVAGLFDCPANTSHHLISCLREQDAYEVYGAGFIIKDDTHNPINFAPVVENKVGKRDEAFLTDYPKNILLSEDLELVPWMVGFTSSDGAFLISIFPDFFQGDGPQVSELEENYVITTLVSSPQNKTLVNDVAQMIRQFYFTNTSSSAAVFSSASDMLTDIFFFAGVNSAVRFHSKREATVYYYLFDYRGSNSFISLVTNLTFETGPVHLDDLLYLFPQNQSFPNFTLTPEDEDMIETMTSLWVNFTQTGNPAPNWNPVSSPDVLDYVRITGNGLQPGKGIFKERGEFWDSLPFRNGYITSG